MNCPAKACGASIDDDSFYCDQCGRELRRCTSCGIITDGKFCRKDGKPTQALRESTPARAPGVASAHAVPANADPASLLPAAASPGVESSAPGPAETRRLVNHAVAQPSPGAPGTPPLRLRHESGLVLEVRKETILGRDSGEHAQALAAFRSISRQHARLNPGASGWTIEDQNSTNGTWIDGQRIAAGSAFPLRAGSTLWLADQCFHIEEGV